MAPVLNYYMDLWELDHWSPRDDHVTKLRYPDLDADIDCHGA